MVGDECRRALRSTSARCRSDNPNAARLAGTSAASSTSASASLRRIGFSSGNDRASRSRGGPSPPWALVSEGGNNTSTAVSLTGRDRCGRGAATGITGGSRRWSGSGSGGNHVPMW